MSMPPDSATRANFAKDQGNVQFKAGNFYQCVWLVPYLSIIMTGNVNLQSDFALSRGENITYSLLRRRHSDLLSTTSHVQAISLSSLIPIYQSNLSAALFEVGDYPECIATIDRACHLARVPKRDDASLRALEAKLSSRLARALCHSLQANQISSDFLKEHESLVASLKNAAMDENSQCWWHEWDSLVSNTNRNRDARKSHVKLLSLPLHKRAAWVFIFCP